MSGERGNSHTNLEIGRTLELARAGRDLSLWQVEEATKIRARYLHDLERENFGVLPAVYVLGSLKTYADFLRLDGEALVRELKNRQASPPEDRDPMPEEPPRAERGGFLGGLPVVAGRDAVEDDEGAAPATTSGYGFRLYLGVGAILIFALAVALGSIFPNGGEPAVSQVREPTISEAPSRIAFSGDAQDDERYQDANGTDDQPGGKRAESPGEGGEEDKKVDERDQDDTQPEGTGDVAVTLPASIDASASTASASASATATSAPTASASASASSAAPTSAAPTFAAPAFAAPASAAPASAAGTPVASATAIPSSAAPAPAATTPETAEPNAAPRSAIGQPTPGVAGAPAGPRRVVVADGTGPVERIIGEVRIIRVR